MTLLSDTFYLNRASRYANPLYGNDRLPIVYGDLTDGTNGIWELPCIDTVNFVYCFADHAVLSVVNGNAINIYADGVLVNPANYAFDESDDYEGEGAIAKITFAGDQVNAVITARGMGKDDTGVLIENIITILNDFLTVESDFTSSLYLSTAKNKASQIFTAQSYNAAGVIGQDNVIWDTITAMMSSFLGSAYLNGSGELVLEIDNGVISQYSQAGIISKYEANLIKATQRLINIINQCPANYAYNYNALEFKSETDDSAYADTESQNIYGIRKPNTPYQFYWCRDLTSIQTMQAIIVDKFKAPLYEIEIEDITLKRLYIDIGDVFVHSIDSLYDENEDVLYNHYWRVISVNPDFSQAKINFRALQTNYFMTFAYLADGTYIAGGSIKAGNDRDMTTY